MAGIGFKLRKLLQEESALSTIKAYSYGAFISCGPWILTIMGLLAISFIQGPRLSILELQVFRVSVVYSFIFSLIIFGVFQMPLTRYLADLIYTHHYGAYLPTFVSSLFLTGVMCTLIGIPTCFIWNDWHFVYQVHAFALFHTVTFVWVAMTFLSAAQNYVWISASFFIGGATSVALSWYFKSILTVNGFMMCYTIGTIVLFFLLAARILIEFPSDEHFHFGFLKYMKRYPWLVVIGFVYNVAIWIDKFLFWFNDKLGQEINSFLYASHVYDQPMFLAYALVVPAYTIFLVKMETEFYVYYKGFYQAISSKYDLEKITRIKEQLIGITFKNIWSIVRVQGGISLAAIVLAPNLMTLMGLDWSQVVVFRICVLAAFLQALFLIVMVLILYFDFQKECAFMVIGLFTFNAVFTLYSIHLGFPFYGVGIFAASLLTFWMSLMVFERQMNRLEYVTFMKQPF